MKEHSTRLRENMVACQKKERGDVPFVSIIVIGRNEEVNLDACLHSIFSMDYPRRRYEVIYVDTGSTDRSVDIAKRFDIKIAEEHSEFPTPGLARNRGIKEAIYDIVHFVDGDMTVDGAYLRKAVGLLGKDNIVCVLGNVLERRSRNSFCAKVLHFPWRSRRAGIIDAPGAGGTFLKAILEKVGGYNPLILKGQETELGFRLRKNGYQIYMIESPMGTHNYDVDNFVGVFHHFYITGKSLGKLLTLSRQPSYADFRKRAMSLLIQGFVSIALILLVMLTKRYLLLLGIPFVIAIWVIVRYWKKHHGCRDQYALGYYLLMHYAKPIVFLGMISFFWKHIIRSKFTKLFRKKNRLEEIM